MIGPAINWKLANTAGVTAIVGNRIFPQYVRQAVNLFPQVVYDTKNNEPQRSYTGSSGLASVEVNVAAVATTYDAADALAKAIQAALDNQFGTWNGTVILRAFEREVTEDIVTEADSERILYYLKELQYQVWYQN